jgi:hypothetical protein
MEIVDLTDIAISLDAPVAEGKKTDGDPTDMRVPPVDPNEDKMINVRTTDNEVVAVPFTHLIRSRFLREPIELTISGGGGTKGDEDKKETEILLPCDSSSFSMILGYWKNVNYAGMPMEANSAGKAFDDFSVEERAFVVGLDVKSDYWIRLITIANMLDCTAFTVRKRQDEWVDYGVGRLYALLVAKISIDTRRCGSFGEMMQRLGTVERAVPTRPVEHTPLVFLAPRIKKRKSSD